ncbi:hypothetical protein G6F60_014464 [Rhizopus arrhizus]|nr:hypothetical protein G6F65_020342 [Rhizopus arrhizus]KAG1386476.1 hypothetical protein G6F60_014464 [Rhizopus arrhizus]
MHSNKARKRRRFRFAAVDTAAPGQCQRLPQLPTSAVRHGRPRAGAYAAPPDRPARPSAPAAGPATPGAAPDRPDAR